MKKMLRKLKKEIKPFLIIYIIFDVILVGTYMYGAKQHAALKGFNKLSAIFNEYFNDLISFKFFPGIFGNFLEFMTVSFYMLILFVVLFIIWKIQNSTKHEYDGIEHGSSDWAKDGEEFDKTDDGKEILNKKNGFILSKDHYLGTDLKKVVINKNVLVVGRIWCW